MSYYEDEVPKSLDLNAEYTAREIYLFMIENKNVMILMDSVHLNHNDRDHKFKVVDIKENYIHRQAENSYRTHLIPNKKTRIYEIEKIK
ncbi:hypothetical protein E1I69_20450 [Bacillus timonensis]|uniref:Uncharacterized protein n=1 Tax=Bacillus timonensis TaxID=1033734 RepID=A0A4S3PKF4_9BACI|nr:hypothetical protein [Bacillus timonensis]THE09940.1 hypothetical protein E1I69_20450 [Bacillus timonensis]